MENITKLGSKVDYSSQYDPSQIEVFPREPRRQEYTVPMYGVDIWTCFEVSFLGSTGVPEYHVIRIANSANSKNIFESKSLKLYLNSFNNTRFSGIEEVLRIIKTDLSLRVEGKVEIIKVERFSESSLFLDETAKKGDCIDTILEGVEINEYSYNPSLLECRERVGEDIFYTNLLRSNCEVTGQPDWGQVIVQYRGPKTLDRGCFLKYIISYRNHQEFHEPTCERIYNDLYNLLEPSELTVICQYTRRGGIDINPIRSTSFKLKDFSNYLLKLPKILQQ